MGSIYKNALLNISADAAEDGQQGIFKSARWRRRKFDPVALPCHSTKRDLRGNLYVSTHVDLAETQPLQQRAWVLQERVLSTRELRYMSNELSWECAMAVCSEDSPFLSTMRDGSYDFETISKIPHRPLPVMLDISATGDGAVDSNVLTWWYETIMSYAQRGLTFRKDRFPAISALAQEFSRRTGYHYIAGIWVEDFLRGLLWENYGYELDRSHCPSWTWAVNFGEDGFGDIYELDSLEVHGSSFQAQLVAVSDSMNEDPFDSGVFGVLTLCGWCQSAFDFCARLQLREGPHGYSPPHRHPLHDTDLGSLIGYEPVEIVFSSDSPMDPASVQSVLRRRDIILFRISNFKRTTEEFFWTYYLVLDSTGCPANTYRRIGLVKRSVEPDQSPEAATAGWDLQTIGIL